MLHRAIYTRNRDPKKREAGEHYCRMGCKCVEHMVHVVECCQLRPYWGMVIKFLKEVLGESPDNKNVHAIIFNMSRMAQKKMMSVEARAFVRHAFDTFWRDFALVDTNNKAFIPEYTFRRTMENFRNAVLAYGQSIKQFRTQRQYTDRKKHVPEATLRQFPALIKIDPSSYNFVLTEKLISACDDAVRAATAHAMAHPTAAVGGANTSDP